MTIDLDGVICAPHFGVNYGIHRGFLDPDAPPLPATVWPTVISRPWDRLRFELRQPLPGVETALTRLATRYRLTILTGRRTSPLNWLRRHGLASAVDDVIVNDTHSKSAHYKLSKVRVLQPLAHIDDDPRTAQLLAQAADLPVLLRDWPRNRDLPFDANVRRVRDLSDAADLLFEGRLDRR